jgi:glycerol-3-phosphate acyltransferase PlsY
MDLAGLYIYAYLVGAVPTAYIIGRLVRGIDIRQRGSGNVGGSNVFYSVGKLWVVPLGLFELFAKGGSPIWIGMYALDMDRSSYALIAAPLLTLAGNNWSVFLKFTGGRGIAVILGILFALAWKELIVFAVVALAGWAIFRSAGVWVYISLLLLPFWSLLFGEPLAITWFCVGALAIVTVKRILSNWDPFPAGMPKGEVLFNRLFRDRDVAQRDEWIDRGPREKDGSMS